MKRIQFRIFVGMILVAVLTSAFFVFLYNYNNKYTHKATQAMNGLLVLSEKDIETTPYRFLWNDWAYYPNVLLTPNDFSEGDPKRYMTYIDISTENRMDIYNENNSKSRYGCGTYMLRCKLPKSKSFYALDMPEIFSSYDMYINDEKILSVGNNNPNNYQDATVNRMVSFSPDENGMATILIAVNNESHFYSGMIFPPILGTVESVDFICGIRTSLRLCWIFLFLVSAFISLYLWKKTHYRNALYFFILCITMIGWTSYPIIHVIATLPVFPTYLFEMLFCYLTLFMLVLLHNQICEANRISALVSNITSASFCVLIALYILFSKYLNDYTIDIFSTVIFGYKLILAIYLLITSYISVRRHKKALPLLNMSVFFACACIWDRALPKYEPIFGGWFLEWVCMILVIVVGAMLWRFLIEKYLQNILLNQKYNNMENQLTMQISYTNQLNVSIEERRRLTHDFRQHLRVMRTMAEDKLNAEILQYLDTVTDCINATSQNGIKQFCNRPAVDAILNYYENMATERGICINIQFALPKNMTMTDVELCTILGNLMENAIEACGHLVNNIEKRIIIKTATTSMLWYMTIENTFDGKLLHESGRSLQTRKSDILHHGIGLSSVEYILKRYNGTLDIISQDKTFHVGVTVPVVLESLKTDKIH